MPVPSRSIVVGSGVAAGDGEPAGLNGGASSAAIAGAGPAPAGTMAATLGVTATAAGGADAAPPPPPPPTLPPPGAGAPELPPPPVPGDLGGDGRAAGGVALSAGAFWFWNVVLET